MSDAIFEKYKDPGSEEYSDLYNAGLIKAISEARADERAKVMDEVRVPAMQSAPYVSEKSVLSFWDELSGGTLLRPKPQQEEKKMTKGQELVAPHFMYVDDRRMLIDKIDTALADERRKTVEEVVDWLLCIGYTTAAYRIRTEFQISPTPYWCPHIKWADDLKVFFLQQFTDRDGTRVHPNCPACPLCGKERPTQTKET